ncbi:unnamed protein product, partial [Prorocentrum cordatum]
VWSSKDKDLMALLRTTPKLLLQTTHRTRLNSSINIDTYTMTTKHPLVGGVFAGLEGYENMLDKPRSGCAPVLGLAALESLLERDVGGALKREISADLEQAQPSDETAEVEVSKYELQQHISFMRRERCFDADKAKLIEG